MASFKLFFIIIFSILNFATTKAQGPNFLCFACIPYNFIANNTYQANLRTLYSSLSSKATDNTEYYNNTVPAGKSPSSDTVYGMFMCRGDIPSQQCGDCVQNATLRLANGRCNSTIEGVIWYDECMVRYSEHYFFSSVANGPMKVYVSPTPMIYQGSFNRTLFEALNKTADEAAKAPIGAKKFATGEADLPVFQKLYTMAQCTPDLSPEECRSCLNRSINADLPQCCAGREGARVMYPNCIIRFEIYPFYGSPESAPTPTPAGGLLPSSNSGGKVQNYMFIS